MCKIWTYASSRHIVEFPIIIVNTLSRRLPVKSVVIEHESFTHSWPFVADRFTELWGSGGEVEHIKTGLDDKRSLGEILADRRGVDRIVSLGLPLTAEFVRSQSEIKEIGINRAPDEELHQAADESGVHLYYHRSENFWGESVAECGLALTLCGLRRIPQLHREMITSHDPWKYKFRTGANGVERAGQFSDDPRFVNGTIAGKRVRIVGIGNIGSRYASVVDALGADVAAWDPVASDPCFHRAGARKIHHLEELVGDADIFVPMMPLLDATRGIVTGEHIGLLPKGALIVLVTRALICDVDAIRRRVESDEVALAADVHDTEPLSFDDALLGRHNVVHTPHIAGRTITANERWAELLAAQFKKRQP